MPYLLIFLSLTFSLLFTSCKSNKTNALSAPGFKSSLVEQRAFLTIKEDKEIAYFRGKVLNSFVEEKIPSGKAEHQLRTRDELKYYDIDESYLALYANKEKEAAKVIVSYSDRTEVYFLPDNIPLENLASMLNLKPEAERVFKWIKTQTTKTFSGSVLYLVSLNLEDLIKNDQDFYSEEIDFKNDFTGKNLTLISGKILALNVDYSVYLQGEAPQRFEGRVVKCTKVTLESGNCGVCSYTRNTPAGHYNRAENLPLSELGFSVKVGDRVFAINEFNPVVGENSFSVNIDSNDYDMRKEINVELVTSAPAGIVKFANNYGFEGYCGPNTSAGSEIGLARKVEANVVVKMKGRGIEVLKNIL